MSFWTQLPIVALLVLHHANCISGTYQCALTGYQLSCSGINQEEISGSPVATFSKHFIDSLSVINGNLPTISPHTFQNFSSLQTLNIINSKVSQVDHGSLLNMPLLQELSLSGNTLSEFNSQGILVGTVLKYLNLSNNVLRDFSNFNATQFPILKWIDLSNNQLSHLPIDILTKLEEVKDFYVLADNNPWDCVHPAWSSYLNGIMIEAFCNEDYVTSEEPLQENKQEEFVLSMDNDTSAANESYAEGECPKPNCYTCSFYYCLIWMFGGIWFGIILGNIGKIRRLICDKTTTYSDKYTQCDYSIVEQHMISGVFDSKTRKFTPVSALGTSMPNIVLSVEKT